MLGKNGLHIRIQQEETYQNVELFFLLFEKVLKMQASVIGPPVTGLKLALVGGMCVGPLGGQCGAEGLQSCTCEACLTVKSEIAEHSALHVLSKSYY